MRDIRAQSIINPAPAREFAPTAKAARRVAPYAARPAGPVEIGTRVIIITPRSSGIDYGKFGTVESFQFDNPARPKIHVDGENVAYCYFDLSDVRAI